MSLKATERNQFYLQFQSIVLPNISVVQIVSTGAGILRLWFPV